jgi:hypothetical protein
MKAPSAVDRSPPAPCPHPDLNSGSEELNYLPILDKSDAWTTTWRRLLLQEMESGSTRSCPQYPLITGMTARMDLAANDDSDKGNMENTT